MATSAEPGRKAPYSMDLRWRIVWQRISLELPFVEIASRLNVSASTAQRIFTLFVETGDVHPKPQSETRKDLRKLDDHMEMFVVGLILETPSLYLAEVCQKVKEISGVEVSEATICKLIHRHGFTRKKIRQVAEQRSVQLRGEFMAKVLLYNKELFVWVDETGCDNKTHIRKFGYAIRGETPTCHRFLVRGNRISAIAAIATEGLVSCELYTQTVDSDIFFDYIRGNLIPQMSAFDGTSPKSIVIMDNCSIHHVEEVERMFTDAGILVFFLPPYSHDYNPIEETFSYVKSYLRKHDEVLQVIDDPCTIIRHAFHSITPEDCKQWILHSGYC